MSWSGREFERGERVALVNRAGLSRSIRCIALALGGALSACAGPAPTAHPAEQDAGSSGHDGGGGSPDQQSAPECGVDAVPFVPVLVQDSPELAFEWQSRTPVVVQLLEKGVGLPPGGTSGDFYPYRDRVGWLRLGAPSVEAGAPVGDAGDAGDTDDARDARDAGVDAPAFIVGPLALVNLPVEIGDELVLSVQYSPNSPLYLGANQVLLEQGGRVLLFHEVGVLGTAKAAAGFSRVTGATICETSWGCANNYRQELQVTVPDGTTATLAPGQTDTIGGYQVSHGTTASVVRQLPNTCTDILYDSTYSQMTAVLLPQAE